MTIIRPMDDSYFVKQHPIYHPNLVDKMEFYPTKKGKTAMKPTKRIKKILKISDL
jgi:hypothetical protein